MTQEDIHLFQGIRRDNHPIRQDSKFLWDAHNMRITNREDNTLLSLTNERGTSDPLIEFQGYYVGHHVLGKYLIVFTANKDSSGCHIYRTEKTETGYKTIILFHQEGVWDQGWNPNHPIEAIGIYETELVQKVYWVDGINQPRVINIAKPELKLPSYIDAGGTQIPLLIDGVNLSGPTYSQDPNIDRFLYHNIPNGLYERDSFDFVRTLQLYENIEVTKIYGYGEFSSGTIQYAISYYDKYGQESNICYTTPLYYISPNNRGGSPEEKVPNSFIINITGVDDKFDYVRIYSIHRTSIDSTPTVRVVADISTKVEDPIEGLYYTDTGTSGYTIEPTQLLYIGGESIISNCIAQKDNTLFLGSITQNKGPIQKQVEEILLSRYNLQDWSIDNTSSTSSTSSVYYDYTANLSSIYSGGFKSHEEYRCGVQVQYSTGKWSDPIYVGDHILCTSNPWENPISRSSKAIRFSKESGIANRLRNLGIRKIRTCIVFPRVFERDVICQGVLCPTVYSVQGRRNDLPYAMSSWFFRPAVDMHSNQQDVYHGASIQFRHNTALYVADDRGAEIQSMLPRASNLSSISTNEDADKYSSHFFVDENIVTFHSPDLEFDTSLSNYSWEGVSLRIIGMAKLGAISGDIDIQTSSPTSQSDSPGFVHHMIGYQTKNPYHINGGLVSGLFYKDHIIQNRGEEGFVAGPNSFWTIYPWHRSGSLNNDCTRPVDQGTQSSVLSKKRISNLKFFDRNTPLDDNDILFNISTPQLFQSNEVSILKISPSYLKKEVPYFGNVDSLITSNSNYKLFIGASFTGPLSEVAAGDMSEANSPVRMKYKSSPHLVFSLGNSPTEISLLPRHRALGNNLSGNFKFPVWQQSGSTDGSNNDKGKYDYILDLYAKGFLDSYYNSGVPDRALGTCSIGNATSSMYIARADKTNSGNKFIALNKSAEGIVLKATKNITHIYDSTTFLPNTASSDYNYGTYVGKDRYYKVHFLNETNNNISLEDITTQIESGTSTTTYRLSQQVFGDLNNQEGTYPYLLIGELYRDNVIDKFGGDTEEAIRQNLWVPSSRPVDIPASSADIIVPFEYGDTWYSRYDCLKTYPFTSEDENQVVEIGSFMCETRVNIDGRYDRNRGQISNLNVTPQNFNLLNEVYTQKDNFFNYRIFEDDYYKSSKFLNQITWSLEKTPASDTDPWTNITLANTLDMDGEKGKVTALRTWNEYLLCFQEKALSQILFNSRVQIPTTDGVPIEISNGYKVDGSRLFSGNIGCSNKWATTTTTTGIYFLDSNTNSLYVFNGQLANLSEDRGMDWWVRQNHTDKVWCPIDYGRNINGVRAFYDNKYGDVYFTPGPTLLEQPDALCYSEQIGQFTSLMSYGGTQAMFNFADGFYSLRHDGANLKLYQNNVGNYNNFYGTPKGWSFSFISNQNPTITKIFDTIELRTDHYQATDSEQPLNSCPMNYIEVSNEYQHSDTVLLDNINMRKKFRVWRGLLPRNKGTRQRIRNPWSMITLGWKPLKDIQPGDTGRKAIIHDVSVKYTI